MIYHNTINGKHKAIYLTPGTRQCTFTETVEQRKQMNVIKLYIDSSVDPRSKTGFGAYLVVTQPLIFIDDLKSRVTVKRFSNTASTRLELQTLLWALSDINKDATILIYTDCQTLLGLQGRRDRLEDCHYTSRKYRKLSNSELYQQFFTVMDKTACQLIKVRGHKPSATKDENDRLFAFVDKASRKALRDYRNTMSTSTPAID